VKAIVYTKYGSPDVLELQEIEKPVPGDNEVLIKIHAASVNALDWHFMRGKPWPMRFVSGLFKPKNKILGADFAGCVEAVGSKVKKFKPGDEIFGDLYSAGFGALAEYVTAPENTMIVLKPKGSTFEEAAAISVGAGTALQGLRDTGQIEPGQKVLINGASGAVGTFAIQIAKAFGAEVTAVCSTGNVEMARLLGAKQVIDYTHQDFTRSGKLYDLIFDIASNRLIKDYMRALNPGGKCVEVGYSPSLMFKMMFKKSFGDKKIVSMGEANGNIDDLNFLKELIETGKIKSMIDRRYPLSETADAIRYLEKGHARGKVVITIENNN